MRRPLLHAPTVLLGLVVCACGTDTSTQEQEYVESRGEDRVLPPEPSEPATIAVPENPVDRGIRRELSAALENDPNLHDRDISFIVANGDVRVTGVVSTESERRRINDMALAIPEVRSVANSVRVSP